MKRLILLLTVTILYSSSYSQNTSKITIEQIRTANLIFAEHQKFSLQIPLLETKINNLELINESWIKTDSIKEIQIAQYEKIIYNNNKNIEQLTSSIKKRNKIITYGAGVLTISICLLILK